MPRLNDALRAERQSFDAIPVVDIGALVRGEADLSAVARGIRWALANVGFMYIKNHGIPAKMVSSAFAQAQAFFDLPLDEKMRLHIANSGKTLRGYTEIFGENTDPEHTKDLKECFDLGPETPGVDLPFFGCNPWPSALPDFEPAIYGYHQALRQLCMALLEGIAVSLGLARDYFAPHLTQPISIQRLLHYPPQTGDIDARMIGIGAHTDYGCLTILAQDDVGGLQVMNRDGVWIQCPPIADTFVINIGDMMQRLTNDVYIANLHRVVNTTGRERYSIPFFFDVDYHTEFAPLPSCVTPENPSRYDPIVCGEHKFARYVASFPHLQVAAE